MYIWEHSSSTVFIKNINPRSRIVVYDIDGRQCYIATEFTDNVKIDFSNYKKGVYIIRCVQSDGNSYVWKFVNT